PPLCPAGNASTMSSPAQAHLHKMARMAEPASAPRPAGLRHRADTRPPRRGSWLGCRSLARDEDLDQSRKERRVHGVDAVLAIDDDSVLVNEEPHALPYRPPSTE